MKKLFPNKSDEAYMKLNDDIGKLLMDFVCHNQKPFSKSINKLIATGCHDIRAGGVAIDILRLVDQYLNDSEEDK
jgi:hypothetical protein